jgi:hypothetical protein
MRVPGAPPGIATHPEFALRCYFPEGPLSAEPEQVAFYGHTRKEMVWLHDTIILFRPDVSVDLERWNGTNWEAAHG